MFSKFKTLLFPILQKGMIYNGKATMMVVASAGLASVGYIAYTTSNSKKCALSEIFNNNNIILGTNHQVKCDPITQEEKVKKFWMTNVIEMDVAQFKALHRPELDSMLKERIGNDNYGPSTPRFIFLLTKRADLGNVLDIGWDEYQKLKYEGYVQNGQEKVLRHAYWIPKPQNIAVCTWNPDKKEYGILIGEKFNVLVQLHFIKWPGKQDLVQRPSLIIGISKFQYGQKLNLETQHFGINRNLPWIMTETFKGLKQHIPPS